MFVSGVGVDGGLVGGMEDGSVGGVDDGMAGTVASFTRGGAHDLNFGLGLPFHLL